jgi:hypothetical protein
MRGEGSAFGTLAAGHCVNVAPGRGFVSAAVAGGSSVQLMYGWSAAVVTLACDRVVTNV